MEYRFYKINNTEWFIDLPEYLEKGGSALDLQMVAGADTLLDLISNFNSEITLKLTEEKFENCEQLEKLYIPEGLTGCYYHLMSFQGKSFMDIIWLCDVVKFIFNDQFPEIIYFKKIS